MPAFINMAATGHCPFSSLICRLMAAGLAIHHEVAQIYLCTSLFTLQQHPVLNGKSK
jgi:hypothetical protein